MEPRSESVGLHERRRRKEHAGPVNFSQIRRPRPEVRTDTNARFSTMRLDRMTPPETPISPQEAASNPQNGQQLLFHNYLRAFCHFEQPSNAKDGDENLFMTATIRPGDLILVHSIHKNGWADGTVLTTGGRGWLPTNYCETFDHPYMRNLLNAMTQFWDLLGAGEEANLSTFVRQDYIRGLIAGVRYLLEHADCLHREATLVQRNTGIRRMRKGLLADLQTLVQIAKRLQETISEPFAGEVVHVLLDDLVAKAFRVVTRAVGFVDMLALETPDMRHIQPSSPVTSEATSPRRATGGLGINTRTSLLKEGPVAIDSAVEFPPTPAAERPPSKVQENETKGDGEDKTSRSPAGFRPPSGLLAHRLSMIKPEHTPGGILASQQLAQAHDECISHIGAFIGLYLHSRPSSELVETTENLVNACETLLSVVDQVSSHDAENRIPVQQARVNFRLKVDELTKSTKDVFKFTDGPDDDVVMLPEQSQHLVNVGTSLIRTVGECVIKTRKLIEQVGDFELKHAPLQIDNEKDAGTQLGASSIPEEKDGEEQSGSSKTTPTRARRVSKMLPPAPPLSSELEMNTTDAADFAQPSTSGAPADSSPATSFLASLHESFPTPPRSANTRAAEGTHPVADMSKSGVQLRANSTSPPRKVSLGVSVAGSSDTHQSSMRDSGITTVSEASTRATTPEQSKDPNSPDAALLNSFGSLTSLHSTAATDESGDVESQLLQKTYAHELTLNKDGQVSGGSLPALVEKLTAHDSAPDPQFVVSFFLTFRSFTTPRELAQALTHRYDYVGDSKTVGTPVRLRIYNVFKGWLETYWNSAADKDALGDIRYFALHKLKPNLPQAGERLVELTKKVTAAYSNGATTGPLVSGVGKTSMSISSSFDSDQTAPEPILTKQQLNMLRSSFTSCNITDFDPLELARQLTLLASKTFCEIQPEELLSLEWNKKNTSNARNVRSMCALNTDLAHVVGDTILAPDDVKKRAVVIKHWSKIAHHCLELNNYESLMAIMCSLNSSVVQRLKRTWDIVSKKSKARLGELNQIVDFSRNHASLRGRLENPVAPCLPFLGIYLTDLTFVDAGNPKTRELPGTNSESGEPISVINFDKHMRMAKIIGHVQKFQIPYKLQEMPEMQSWMQSHLKRMRDGHSQMVGHLHRRSVAIEPKDLKKMMQEGRRHTEPAGADERPKTSSVKGEGQHFGHFMKTNFSFKSKGDLHDGAEK